MHLLTLDVHLVPRPPILGLLASKGLKWNVFGTLTSHFGGTLDVEATVQRSAGPAIRPRLRLGRNASNFVVAQSSDHFPRPVFRPIEGRFLKDQMTHKLEVIYHILFSSQYGILDHEPFLGSFGP